MRPHVDGLRRRGIDAVAVDLPKGNAERAAKVYAQEVRDVDGPCAVGGHSYGGRVASLLCADDELNPAALVLLSYPLHRPGHVDDLRVEHWPEITCPVLLLSGESDPFARVDVLRSSVKLLRAAELHTYTGVGHGLAPVLVDALDRIAAFMRRVEADSRRVVTKAHTRRR